MVKSPNDPAEGPAPCAGDSVGYRPVGSSFLTRTKGPAPLQSAKRPRFVHVQALWAGHAGLLYEGESRTEKWAGRRGKGKGGGERPRLDAALADGLAGVIRVEGEVAQRAQRLGRERILRVHPGPLEHRDHRRHAAHVARPDLVVGVVGQVAERPARLREDAPARARVDAGGTNDSLEDERPS